jgi:hypothetical protein
MHSELARLKLYCTACNNTGWKIVHRQGDPVPDSPGRTYASTETRACGCRVATPAVETIILPYTVTSGV